MNNSWKFVFKKIFVCIRVYSCVFVFKKIFVCIRVIIIFVFVRVHPGGDLPHFFIPSFPHSLIPSFPHFWVGIKL